MEMLNFVQMSVLFNLVITCTSCKIHEMQLILMKFIEFWFSETSQTTYKNSQSQNCNCKVMQSASKLTFLCTRKGYKFSFFFLINKGTNLVGE